MAVAVQWATRVTTIALEMVVPALLGWWLDQYLGTRLVFLALGGILGLITGMRSLLRIAEAANRRNGTQRSDKSTRG